MAGHKRATASKYCVDVANWSVGSKKLATFGSCSQRVISTKWLAGLEAVGPKGSQLMCKQ
jgi:hypothetical protein